MGIVVIVTTFCLAGIIIVLRVTLWDVLTGTTSRSKCPDADDLGYREEVA